MLVEIPKCNDAMNNFPCWCSVVTQVNYKEVEKGKRNGRYIEPIYKSIKPSIICKCGVHCGINLHHVHSDGRVTASFYHKRTSEQPKTHKGCGWHVFLKLLDYDKGDFPPEKKI